MTLAVAFPRRRLAARLAASLLGLGHVPWAPGTLASLVALPIGAWLIHLGSAALPEAVLAATIGGLVAIEHSGAATEDPGWIVIDELAGQLLAMVTLARASLVGLAVAFVLFRLLDITKPGPIGKIDRSANAAGVMGDDLLAGAAVAALLWLVQRIWPHLLG